MQTPEDREDKMVVGPPPEMKDPLTANIVSVNEDDPREAGLSVDERMLRREAKRQRDESNEQAVKNSMRFQGDDTRPMPRGQVHTELTPIVLSTYRGHSFRVPRAYGGGEIQCNQQVIVDRRTLRMLRGFQRRGIIDLVEGPIKLAPEADIKKAAQAKSVQTDEPVMGPAPKIDPRVPEKPKEA